MAPIPEARIEVIQDGRAVQLVKGTPLLTSAAVGWQGLLLEQHAGSKRFENPEHVNTRAHILHLHYASQAEWRIDGHAKATRIESNDSSLLPVGSHVSVAVAGDSAATGLILEIDTDRFRRTAGELVRGGEIELKQQIVFSDRQLTLLMKAMQADLEAGCPAGPLYGESLGQALSVYLARRYAVQPTQSPIFKGGLAKFRLNRVLEYIDANLNEGIRLSSLADVAGLSMSHFTTAFRESTGVSPHQYFLSKRIERAKQLLKNPTLSVLEASARTGFVDQAHFSKVFRRFTGTSPTQFRTER